VTTTSRPERESGASVEAIGHGPIGPPPDVDERAADPAPAPSDVIPGPPNLAFEKWMGFLSSFVAPVTLITALLFYFGYVSSRTFFAYFGIDVDVLGLSNQAFVMRSPGALFVPLVIALILAAALVVGHRLLRKRLKKADAATRWRVVAVIAWTGIGLILAGIALALLWGVFGGWELAPLVTPLLLAVGAGLAAYAASTARALRGGAEGRSVVVLLVVAMVAGAFWATATLAEWWGRGQARALAADLTSLPAVVLDTQERMFPGNDEILFQQLEPHDEGQMYRYRYHGLRLLVQGGGRLFLVPDQWSPDASTLVVPYDDSVRVRFRFFPDANPPG